MGLPGPELAKLIVRELALPISAEQYTKEARQVQESTFPQCQLLPGAEALVRHLASRFLLLSLIKISHIDC